MSNLLRELRAQGFDEAYQYHTQFGRWAIRPKCSQCEALCINGVACHETGCPNQRYECKGCNALLEHPGYCADCQ